MKYISESLRANDLKNLIKPVFQVDAYQSKIGNDSNIVVLSFTVDREEPAKDLENFIEMGYDFVLDADVSPGETDDGVYTVFVELERNRHVPEQIMELLNGIEKLTGDSEMRFRYFKSFKSHDVNIENLEAIIPLDIETYNNATELYNTDNYQGFFANSSVDDVSVQNESIKFEKQWADPLEFKILDSGPKTEIYNSINGPIMMENKDISEVMFFTKYIGNYNITKIGNTFIFENSGWAVALEKK